MGDAGPPSPLLDAVVERGDGRDLPTEVTVLVTGFGVRACQSRPSRGLLPRRMRREVTDKGPAALQDLRRESLLPHHLPPTGDP